MKKGPSKDKQLDLENIFKPKKYPQRMKEVKALSLCMMEFFYALEIDDTSLLPIDIQIRDLAMIGAAGRLFEALLHGEEKVGKKVFPFAFLSGLRAVLYHINDPYSQLNAHTVFNRRTFFKHIYDYCRTELHTLFGKSIYPALSTPLNKAERDTSCFKEAVHYAIEEGKIHRRKLKPELQKKLSDNADLFNSIIQHLKANPGYAVVDDSRSSLQHADIVRGNAVGTLIALISQDATSLEKGDFYLTKEAETKSALSRESRSKMNKSYTPFHQLGNHYRYRHFSVVAILERYQVRAVSSAALQSKIDQAVKNKQVAQVQALLPQWQVHPSVVKSNVIDDPALGDWLLMAADQGCLPMVQYLFEHPVRNSWRAFAVVHAAMHGRVDTLLWLLTARKWSMGLINYAMDCAESGEQSATLAVLQNHWREHNVTIQKPASDPELEQEFAPDKHIIKQLEELLISDDSEDEDVSDELLTPTCTLRFNPQSVASTSMLQTPSLDERRLYTVKHA